MWGLAIQESYWESFIISVNRVFFKYWISSPRCVTVRMGSHLVAIKVVSRFSFFKIMLLWKDINHTINIYNILLKNKSHVLPFWIQGYNILFLLLVTQLTLKLYTQEDVFLYVKSLQFTLCKFFSTLNHTLSPWCLSLCITNTSLILEWHNVWNWREHDWTFGSL